MASYIVWCHDCEKARKWMWLCRDCAVECRDRHRADTGHSEIVVTNVDESMKVVQAYAKRLHRITGGW